MSGKLKPHASEYRHGGKTYLLPILATDCDDAKARIRSAYFNGQPLERVFGVGV